MFDAPRELVYQAFTDPDQLAAWWGPIGNSLPRDEIEFDLRPAAINGGPRSLQPNPAFAFTSTSTSHTSPTASCSRASCRQLASCRRTSSRSRRDSESSSTMRPTEARDSRSASGSPSTWRPPARRVGSRRLPSWTPR
ncbi:MAG: SRPBCC domain-containing protein [Acidimicrobiales bacterium]